MIIIVIVLGKVQDPFVYIPPQMPELAIMKSLVNPSMRNRAPYKPWIISNTNGEIRSAHCDCIAG